MLVRSCFELLSHWPGRNQNLASRDVAFDIYGMWSRRRPKRDGSGVRWYAMMDVDFI